MKFAPFGVGMLGTAVAGVLRCLPVDDELPASDRSGTDTVNNFFRLCEEKFFLSMPGPAELLLLSRAGESGTEGTLSSLSFVVLWYRFGMGGIVLGVVSAEPGPGRDGAPFRTVPCVGAVAAGEGSI